MSIPSRNGVNSLPKPWERAVVESGSTLFEPSSSGSTSDVLEASGNAKAGEIVPADNNGLVNRNSVGGPSPRPWERNIGNNTGVYNVGSNYNTMFGAGPYGSALGYDGTYGGSPYANNPYGGGYGSYGSSYGGTFGNYGMGMNSPYNNLGPNGPLGQPALPPNFWMKFLNVMGRIVQTFSRIAMIVNDNTNALHLLVTALPQIFGNSGRLYAELAPFVFRILGFKSKAKIARPWERAAPSGAPVSRKFREGSKAVTAGWETYWGK